MATLADRQQEVFREDTQRLLRALFDSIEKEGSLLRELRQMKESLVAVALRLQVSYQITEMDELTMNELRKEVSDARMAALSANKQFQEAADVIVSLKREIGSLKRQMKDVRNVELQNPNAAPQLAAPPVAIDKDKVFSSPPKKGEGAPIHLGGHSSFGQEADAEVDALMLKQLYSSGKHAAGLSPVRSKQTPFQEWKMQQFLYAPDTLGGSRNHDPVVVSLLNAAASRALDAHATLADRSTKSITAKSAPDNPEAREARELRESLEGLTLPGLQHKNRRKKEKGTNNVWGLVPPPTLLSPPPKRLSSPVAASKLATKVVI